MNPLSRDFVPVIRSLWKLIEVIYASKWDVLTFEKQASLTIHKYIREKIMPIYRKQELALSNSMPSSANSKGKSTILNSTIALQSTTVSPSPTTNPPVAPPSNKNMDSVKKKAPKPLIMKKSYAQASKSNISSNIKDVL